jgi:two-component system NtrC family sensor kinase
MKPKPKSLRSILTLWFLAFTIVPLAFISGYTLVLYESSLNSELRKRLEGNVREVGVGLADLERLIINNATNIHAVDPALSYHVATRNIPSARRIVTEWLKSPSTNRIALFDREGRLIVSQARGPGNEIKAQNNLETGDFFLTDQLLAEINTAGQKTEREVVAGKGLDLMVYTRIAQKGKTVGYIEEVVELGQNFVLGLKKRLNLEAVIFDDKNQPAASSNEDFFLYPKDFFPGKLRPESQPFFDLTSRGEPYGMIIKPIIDTKGKPYVTLGLATSKTDSQKVLRRIKITLFTSTVLVLLFLIPILIYVSNRVVKPLNQLVEATQKMESGRVVQSLANTSDTEIGILIDSFNRMARNISLARKELEQKISEVETTNVELKNTQTSLVHSAKMASLGQLVAGVAHELNNPIGFIYSNMSHLREYVEKLGRVLETAENNPEGLKKVKEEVEFDFLIDDLPKLIASCEDGARRTRDIVLGLRNFSRLDEAQLKKVDLHEGLSNTLRLLTSELKNRIKVHEEFGKLPEVRCYVSQLNQVFMNILSNAAQAIEKSGEIWIKTWQEDKWAFVSIRDSGPGISKEDLDKIFDPFFTTKPIGRGTGLGLSISYGIVQKHGGELTVESKKGWGTEFKIKIPVDGPADEKNPKAQNIQV